METPRTRLPTYLLLRLVALLVTAAVLSACAGSTEEVVIPESGAEPISAASDDNEVAESADTAESSEPTTATADGLRQTTGTLTLVVDGVTTLMEGSCILRSQSAIFGGENADFSVTINAEGKPLVAGSIFVAGVDTLAAWSPANQSEEIGPPTASLTGSGFAVEGMLSNVYAFGEAPVAGVVGLRCN